MPTQFGPKKQPGDSQHVQLITIIAIARMWAMRFELPEKNIGMLVDEIYLFIADLAILVSRLESHLPIDEGDVKSMKTKHGELREHVAPLLNEGVRRKRRRVANPENVVLDTDSV